MASKEQMNFKKLKHQQKLPKEVLDFLVQPISFYQISDDMSSWMISLLIFICLYLFVQVFSLRKLPYTCECLCEKKIVKPCQKGLNRKHSQT